jgi:hypothetical protein
LASALSALPLRPIHLSPIGYFMLIMGAGVTLWPDGPLVHLSPTAVTITAAPALLPGPLLAATSSRSRTIAHE